MGVLREFLPNDRECQYRIEDFLMRAGYEGNVELINVPPERDELDKLALERATLEDSSINLAAGSITRALHTLARIHTGDDEQAGFNVKMGAMPGPFEYGAAEYCAAWKAVRDHLHLPTEPGQYPQR
jgi:hypothetical protein